MNTACPRAAAPKINHHVSAAVRWLLLLVALTGCTTNALAQSATATLSGSVTDEQGAVVVKAAIKAVNTATNLERKTTTNSEGFFTLPLLPPGNYTLIAERDGFATINKRDVILNVGDQRSVLIQLRVSNVAATVTVTDEASLQNESSAVSTVVDRRFVENQPLNGRSFQSLVELAPGVVLTPSNVTAAGQFSVNGQRANANYLMVDGVSANFGTSVASSLYQSGGGALPAYSALGGTNTLASVEAVQEFAVQTSTFAPEFGRQPGGQISVITRSGTNDFHGSLFNYLRNDVFDANDYFANSTGQPRPALRQNNFGGVLGGPLMLPRFGSGGKALLDGRNRTFFFFSYEGLRLRQPVTSDPQEVPSLIARRNAPASVRPILEMFPLPNRPSASGNPSLGSFIASFSNPSSFDATSIRVDHKAGNRLTLFGRYNHAPSEVSERAFFSTPNTLSLRPSNIKTLTFGATMIISSRVSNDLRMNFSVARAGERNIVDGFGGAVVPPGQVFLPSFAGSERSLGIVYIGESGLNFGVNSNNLQRQYNVVNNLLVSVGTHTLKFGFDYRRLTPVNRGAEYLRALFFDTVDDVIAGKVPFFLAVSAEAILRPIYNNYSAYAQDTWRVAPRLTLTYGARYEINPAPTEANGNFPLTVTGFESPATVRLAPKGTRYYETTWQNIAPRIGAAWQALPRFGTIVRAGFGVFYDLGYAFTGSAISPGAFPYGNTVVEFDVPLTSPLLTARVPPAVLAPPYGDLLAYERDYQLPYTLHYNLTMEQSLGVNNTFTLGYVGAGGRRLSRIESLRDLTPDFTRIDVVRNAAISNYHSLQAQFQRRFSRGLQALLSYTWAKSIDTASDESTTNFLAPLGQYDIRLDRGPSAFDVRHNLSAAVSYELPTLSGNRFTRAAFGGWALDSIYRARSATPINVVTGTDPLGLGYRTVARPDVLPNVPLYVADAGAPGGRRINRAAFVEPATARQGTLGRNALRGFGAFQLDTSLRRQFKLTERVQLQARADAFNLFNRPNFADPVGNLRNPNFGVSTQMLGRGLGGLNPVYQIGGPRSLQFALKLIY